MLRCESYQDRLVLKPQFFTGNGFDEFEAMPGTLLFIQAGTTAE